MGERREASSSNMKQIFKSVDPCRSEKIKPLNRREIYDTAFYDPRLPHILTPAKEPNPLKYFPLTKNHKSWHEAMSYSSVLCV